MIRIPQSYNGFLFQQASDRVASSFDTPYDWDVRGISTNNVPRNQNTPKYSGKTYGGDVKVINVVLNKVMEDRDSLVIAMDVEGDQQHPLYALDEFGKLWYVMATCTGLNNENVDENTGSFGYIFEVDDPTWIEYEEQEDTWFITADGDEHTINVTGNQNVRATFEVTPTSSPAGYWPYKQYIKNYNPIALAQTDGIDITNGGWDTQALVTGGKMLASGDDLRVIMDGAEIPRWFGGGGINSTTTKIFIRQTWLPGQSIALRTFISNVGTPAQIQFVVNATNKATLGKLPPSGILRLGTEEFSYTNKNVNACNVDIVERSIRDTLPATHAINSLALWVEHDIQVIYGNSTADTPVYDDTYKPVFSMTAGAAANDNRVYTEFADTAGLRAGRWTRLVLNPGKGKLSRVYSGNEGSAVEVDPATDMGMEIAAFQTAGRWTPETAELAWQLYHPAGIATVTSNGEKYKALSTTTWPTKAGLRCSPNGVNWGNHLWDEAAPPSPASWATTWSHNGVTITAGSKYVQFHFLGSVNGLQDNLARFEVDGATVALTTANVIQVGMNGESSSYQFTIEIENETTGESMIVDYPVIENTTLTIDTDGFEATYKGMNAIRAIDWDTIRTEWLKLVPGPNVLKYRTLFSTGDLTWVTKYHNRSR